MLGNLSSVKMSYASYCNFYQFSQNSGEILTEWQTAWNLIRSWVTQHLVWFQAVCKANISVSSNERIIQWYKTYQSCWLLRIFYDDFQWHKTRCISSGHSDCSCNNKEILHSDIVKFFALLKTSFKTYNKIFSMLYPILGVCNDCVRINLYDMKCPQSNIRWYISYISLCIGDNLYLDL